MDGREVLVRLSRLLIEESFSLKISLKLTKPMRYMSEKDRLERATQLTEIISQSKTEEEVLDKAKALGYI